MDLIETSRVRQASTGLPAKAPRSRSFVFDSESSSPTVVQNSHRNRPCDSCRKRKSRCVVNINCSTCVLCDFHGQECTYLDIPPSRKRKSAQENGPFEDAKRFVSAVRFTTDHHSNPCLDDSRPKSPIMYLCKTPIFRSMTMQV